MNETLKGVISKSKFLFIEGQYIYCKVSTWPEKEHFLVTDDGDEITVVTTKDRIGELALIERNKDEYALIRLDVSLPFYAIGFLSAVTSAIAQINSNVLAVSTFSKDYVLVRTEHRTIVRSALLERGLREL